MSIEEEAGECTHSLYYDDYKQAQDALAYVRKVLGAQAYLWYPEEFYTYAVAFVTDEEFSEKEAQELIQTLSPDAYDFNEQGEDDDDELGSFPEVFTSRERDLAIERIDDEVTLEYIARLELIASTAFAYYAKSQSKGYHGEPELAHALYQALSSVNFMR